MTFLSAWRLVLLLAPGRPPRRLRARAAPPAHPGAALHQRRPARLGGAQAVGLAAARAGGRPAALARRARRWRSPSRRWRCGRRRTGRRSCSRSTPPRRCRRPTSPPSRLEAWRSRRKTFVKNLPKGIQVGLVTFDGNARLLVPPTTDTAPVLDALGSLPVGGGTATADGITTALSAIARCPKGTSGKPTPAVIVLMSDGTPTIGDGDADPVAAADAAAADGEEPSVPIDTIAFGTSGGSVTVQGQDVAGALRPARPWRASPRRAAARRSPRRPGPARPRSTTRSVATSATSTHTRELTAAFAGVALLRGPAARRRPPWSGPSAWSDPRPSEGAGPGRWTGRGPSRPARRR